jgi:hypothetical protein
MEPFLCHLKQTSQMNIVTARPNLPYIIHFGPYRPHDFVPGDVSPLLSLTSQNAYNKLATSILNKVSYHSLTRRCGILQICFMEKKCNDMILSWILNSLAQDIVNSVIFLATS